MSRSGSEGSASPQETKKRRIGDVRESSHEPEATLTRVPDLWFEDGNIILQAETKQFRVHRGHIAVQSVTFAELFIIPALKEGKESMVDGCPVIHLPDRAEDWENLLMAIYNVFRTNRLQKEYPISRILSLLRLGARYGFDYFRNVGAEGLRCVVPIEFDEWLSSPSYRSDVADINNVPFTQGYEFDLVNTALEVGLHSLLPVLCFICLRDRSMCEILEGITREDGTQSILSREFQHRIVCAREPIATHAINQGVLAPLGQLERARNAKTVACRSTACRLTLNMGPTYARILLFAEKPGGAFQSTEKLFQCENCNEFMVRKMREGRLAIWERLPLDFGLPPWGEAKDFDDDDEE